MRSSTTTCNSRMWKLSSKAASASKRWKRKAAFWNWSKSRVISQTHAAITVYRTSYHNLIKLRQINNSQRRLMQIMSQSCEKHAHLMKSNPPRNHHHSNNLSSQRWPRKDIWVAIEALKTSVKPYLLAKWKDLVSIARGHSTGSTQSKQDHSVQRKGNSSLNFWPKLAIQKHRTSLRLSRL